MGTRYRGTASQIRALNAYIALVRAAESMTARLGKRLADERLTTSQFGALEALHHLGPMCQRDLGLKILKSSGNITLVVDNLEKRRLVRRERQGSDRRYVLVHLTPEGRRLIRRIFPAHVDAIVGEMGVLSAAQQKKLRCLCRKIGTRSED